VAQLQDMQVAHYCVAEIRTQLGESSAVEEICAVLRGCQKHDDRKVAKLALGSLSNLASSDSNRDAMAKTDVAQTLLEASRVFIGNENVIEYAVGAISHLVVHEGCCTQLQRAGAVEALLLFVSEHKEDLQVVSKSVVALRKVIRRAGQGGFGPQQAVLQQVRVWHFSGRSDETAPWLFQDLPDAEAVGAQAAEAFRARVIGVLTMTRSIC